MFRFAYLNAGYNPIARELRVFDREFDRIKERILRILREILQRLGVGRLWRRLLRPNRSGDENNP